MNKNNEKLSTFDSSQPTTQELADIESLLNNLLPKKTEEEISSEEITRKMCRAKLNKLLSLSKE